MSTTRIYGLGGGDNILHQAIFELDNNQIKALPTTRVTIIEPTEVLNYSGSPSRIVVPTSLNAIFDCRGGGYTNLSIDPDPSMTLAIGSDWSLNYGKRYLNIKTSLGNAELSMAAFVAGLDNDITFDGTGEIHNHTIPGTHMRLTNTIYDNAVVLAMSNGANGNLLSGHASNTLRLFLTYFLFDLDAGTYL